MALNDNQLLTTVVYDDDSGADSDVPGSISQQKKMTDAHARSIVYHRHPDGVEGLHSSTFKRMESPSSFVSSSTVNQEDFSPKRSSQVLSPHAAFLANENHANIPRSMSTASRLPNKTMKFPSQPSQQHKRSKSEGGSHSQENMVVYNIQTTERDADDCLVFCEPVSSKLICMLCNKVFRDPVITGCGHTFCNQCVVASPSVTCPTDATKLVVVVVNLAVREQIGELYVHCKYGCSPASNGKTGEYEVNRNGCPLTIKITEQREHEENCQYAPITCPNSSLCPALIKMELNDHLNHCQQARCPHARFNCNFEGTSSELIEHLQSCRFEGMKGFLNHTEQQMEELRSVILRKDQEVEFMRGLFSKLSEKIESLEKAVEVRIDLLDENLTKLSSDFIETRRCLGHIEKEITSMDSRTFNIGAFDVQSVLKCKGTFVGHHGPVWSLTVFSSLLFSGSSDNSIKVWDTRSNYTCIKTFSEHSGMVLTLCAYRGKLYSGSADCTISVFDIESLKLMENFSADDNPICTLAIGNAMLFSGSLKSIKVWDLDSLKLIQTLGGLNHWIRALCTTENYLYCGSYQTIKIWDLKSLEQVRVIQTQGGSVYSLVVSREYIICGTYENCIHIWNVKTYQSVARLTGHVGTVYDLVLMTLVDATRVISASYDGSLRVWSLDNLQCVQTLFRHQGSVTALAVCRGRLFSGSVDSTVKVWL